MTTEKVLEMFVDEGRSDYVGLWELIKVLREECGVTEEVALRRATLGLVRQLIESGMVAGKPTWNWQQFLPWQLTTKETLQRIEAEWLALGREPNLWEIVWFITPDEPGLSPPQD